MDPSRAHFPQRGVGTRLAGPGAIAQALRKRQNRLAYALTLAHAPGACPAAPSPACDRRQHWRQHRLTLSAPEWPLAAASEDVAPRRRSCQRLRAARCAPSRAPGAALHAAITRAGALTRPVSLLRRSESRHAAVGAHAVRVRHPRGGGPVEGEPQLTGCTSRATLVPLTLALQTYSDAEYGGMSTAALMLAPSGAQGQRVPPTLRRLRPRHAPRSLAHGAGGHAVLQGALSTEITEAALAAGGTRALRRSGFCGMRTTQVRRPMKARVERAGA